MGLKRITAVVEVVYSSDDGRSLDQLSEYTQQGFRSGASMNDGLLASFVLTSKSQDPDPEPVAEDVAAAPVTPEAG